MVEVPLLDHTLLHVITPEQPEHYSENSRSRTTLGALLRFGRYHDQSVLESPRAKAVVR